MRRQVGQDCPRIELSGRWGSVCTVRGCQPRVHARRAPVEVPHPLPHWILRLELVLAWALELLLEEL